MKHSRNLFSILTSLFLIGLFSCTLEHREAQNEINTTQPIVHHNNNQLPSIQGINHLGDSIDIQKINSKYILLEFWASWCPPCRKANPGYVSVYDKYQSKGFEIFSISLDDNHSKWIGAISKDNLHWKYHYCDYKSWNAYWARQYNIEQIPNNILFDSKGNIIATELDPIQLDRILADSL